MKLFYWSMPILFAFISMATVSGAEGKERLWQVTVPSSTGRQSVNHPMLIHATIVAPEETTAVHFSVRQVRDGDWKAISTTAATQPSANWLFLIFREIRREAEEFRVDSYALKEVNISIAKSGIHDVDLFPQRFLMHPGELTVRIVLMSEGKVIAESAESELFVVDR